MSGDKKAPIIKKIIKKGHGGHHGGSWKVAYADAMMAFFLVMWLLAISSEAGRAALADYFNELTMQDAIFNGGLPSAFTEGGSQGPSILDGGCFQPKTEGDATVNMEGQASATQGQVAALLEATQTMAENLQSLPEGSEGGEGAGDQGAGLASEAQRNFAEDVVDKVEGSLGDAAAGQVAVEKIKGGLRIQIMDKDGLPLFRSGGAALTENGRAMMNVIAQRLATIPNKISIEGHTDALPFPGSRMTNWELSAARASATRMLLAADGVADSRVTMVAGMAATQPLPNTDPNDPINRRISIMIWDEEPQTPPARPIDPAAAAPADDAAVRNAAPSPPTIPGLGRQNGNGASGSSTTASTPPPLPRTNLRRPGAAPIPTAPLSGRELENLLVERTMDTASKPDLSTVGPPVTEPIDPDFAPPEIR